MKELKLPGPEDVSLMAEKSHMLPDCHEVAENRGALKRSRELVGTVSILRRRSMTFSSLCFVCTSRSCTCMHFPAVHMLLEILEGVSLEGLHRLRELHMWMDEEYAHSVMRVYSIFAA